MEMNGVKKNMLFFECLLIKFNQKKYELSIPILKWVHKI